MAHEPFTDYERGVLGLRSKSGLPTAEYQLGSQGKRDPATGQKKDSSQTTGDAGGFGLIFLGLVLGAYYVGLGSFNFLKNRFRMSGNLKQHLLNHKEVSALSHITNTSAPLISITAGVSIGEQVDPVNGIIVGLSTMFAMSAGSVLLNSYSKKNITHIKRSLAAFSIVSGMTLVGMGTVIGNKKLQDSYVFRNTPYTHIVTAQKKLNVRGEPSTTSYIAYQVWNNQCLRVTNISNGWAQIAVRGRGLNHTNGGYVSTRYITPKGNRRCPK